MARSLFPSEALPGLPCSRGRSLVGLPVQAEQARLPVLLLGLQQRGLALGSGQRRGQQPWEAWPPRARTHRQH